MVAPVATEVLNALKVCFICYIKLKCLSLTVCNPIFGVKSKEVKKKARQTIILFYSTSFVPCLLLNLK